MEEQTNVQETVQETTNVEATGKRPGFLTVLCILSFIGSGLGILSMLLLIVGAGAILSFLGSMGGAEGAGSMAYLVGSLILSLATLFGAIQMWKLKKMGFFIYTGASVIGIILPIVFTGFSVFTLVINAAFIVMYYLNLKHMS